MSSLDKAKQWVSNKRQNKQTKKTDATSKSNLYVSFPRKNLFFFKYIFYGVWKQINDVQFMACPRGRESMSEGNEQFQENQGILNADGIYSSTRFSHFSTKWLLHALTWKYLHFLFKVPHSQVIARD